MLAADEGSFSSDEIPSDDPLIDWPPMGNNSKRSPSKSVPAVATQSAPITRSSLSSRQERRDYRNRRGDWNGRLIGEDVAEIGLEERKCVKKAIKSKFSENYFFLKIRHEKLPQNLFH